MKDCMWECLKYALGFWGAVAVLGLILAGIAAATVSTGGAGAVAVPLLEAVLASALGAAGIKLAVAGGSGIIGSLIGCLAGCFATTP